MLGYRAGDALDLRPNNLPYALIELIDRLSLNAITNWFAKLKKIKWH